MKVLLLAPMGSVHRQHNRANIKALKELGADICLAANFDSDTPREKSNGSFVEECKRGGVMIVQIPFKRAGFITNILRIPELNRFIRKEKFDIIHIHTETGGFFFRLSCLTRSKIGKYIYTAHGMSFWRGSSLKSNLLYKPIERWICSVMDANIGINKEETALLKTWNANSAKYVHGIGLDIERFNSNSKSVLIKNELNVEKTQKLVVSVGELDDNKNHITVIKALGMLGRKDFKYVVCGVGPNKDMLLKEAEKMGLKDNVLLAGYRSDIPDVLNAADIFVFPSFHEGMPVSVLEAMACGLPVIASDIRGNVDIIKDGDNGYLFAPANANTLCEKLELLMDDADKRKTMGIKNREIVKGFSLEAVTEELKRIYLMV